MGHTGLDQPLVDSNREVGHMSQDQLFVDYIREALHMGPGQLLVGSNREVLAPFAVVLELLVAVLVLPAVLPALPVPVPGQALRHCWPLLPPAHCLPNP